MFGSLAIGAAVVGGYPSPGGHHWNLRVDTLHGVPGSAFEVVDSSRLPRP